MNPYGSLLVLKVHIRSRRSLWVLIGPYALLCVLMGPYWSLSELISPSGSLCVLMLYYGFKGSL